MSDIATPRYPRGLTADDGTVLPVGAAPADGEVLVFSGGMLVGAAGGGGSVDVTANYSWTGTHDFGVEPTISGESFRDALGLGAEDTVDFGGWQLSPNALRPAGGLRSLGWSGAPTWGSLYKVNLALGEGFVGWGNGTIRTKIVSPSAGIVEVNNGLNPQELRVYERDGGTGDRQYHETVANAGGPFVSRTVGEGAARRPWDTDHGPGGGPILTSPDGSRYRVAADNAGNLITAPA